MSEAQVLSRKADFPGMVTADGQPWHYLDTAATAPNCPSSIAATAFCVVQESISTNRWFTSSVGMISCSWTCRPRGSS